MVVPAPLDPVTAMTGNVRQTELHDLAIIIISSADGCRLFAKLTARHDIDRFVQL